MARLTWLALGLGAGVYAVRRLQRVALPTVGPEATVGSTVAGLSEAVARFRAELAAQERRLTEALLPSEDDVSRARAARRAFRGGDDATPTEAEFDWGLGGDDPELHL